MKKMAAIWLVLALALSMVGTAAMADNGVLNVYNWGEYIDKQVITNFEKEYGVRVNYSLFSSNEEMYTKLMSGASYDVLVPSDYMIERLLKENMLQPIDKNVVNNLDNLCEGVRNLSYDPDNTYSVPYLWQTVGIVYDTTKIGPGSALSVRCVTLSGTPSWWPSRRWDSPATRRTRRRFRRPTSGCGKWTRRCIPPT